MSLRKKTTRSRSRKPRPAKPGRLGLWLRSPGGHAVIVALVWLLFLGGAATAGVWGLYRLEDHLLGPDQAGQVVDVNIYLPNRPVWLPVSVARRIATDSAVREVGFYDRDLLRMVHDRALASPWVRRVRSVRKRLSDDGQVGSIEIDCEYRKPVARVALDYSGGAGRNAVVYVDAEGVRLPSGQVPKVVAQWTDADGETVVRTYADAGASQPDSRCYQAHYPLITTWLREAPAVGEGFDDPALADGLRLALLIADRPYADQITVIDVRNHGGLDPNAPHLKMTAQIGRGQATEIQFGRFPRPGGADVVIPTDRKLAYLDHYAGRHNGRLAGVDAEIRLQYDHLYYASGPH